MIMHNKKFAVEAKDKDGIFTSFYRADKAHSRAEGRFGLGLAIAQTLVNRMGGFITVKSVNSLLFQCLIQFFGHKGILSSFTIFIGVFKRYKNIKSFFHITPPFKPDRLLTHKLKFFIS